MVKQNKGRDKANAVFEGGGVKGIGLAGALTVASRYYDWTYVAGTSAGSLVAALVAADYTPEEIRDLIFDLDYKKFEDNNTLGQVPFVGPFLNVRFKLGMHKGNYIENWIRDKLKLKGIQRFGDLVVNGDLNKPQERYRLRVIASDISTSTMLVLPQDISRYGIDPDSLDIAQAIRMSTSIPFFFEPVALKYRGNGNKTTKSYIVDGGVLSNYPIWLFDGEKGPGRRPTIGFRLSGPHEGRPHDVTGPVSMLAALFNTMLEAHDNKFIEEEHSLRTITIPTAGVRTTDFNISREKTRELYQSGVTAAQKFFDAWDYRVYLARHS